MRSEKEKEEKRNTQTDFVTEFPLKKKSQTTSFLESLKIELFDIYNQYVKENNFEPNFTISFSREGWYRAKADRSFFRYFNNYPSSTCYGYLFAIDTKQTELFKIRIM